MIACVTSIIILEYRFCRRKRAAQHSSLRFYEDPDIRREREMIENMDKYQRRAHNLILDNVTKKFGEITALDRVCLCLSEYDWIICNIFSFSQGYIFSAQDALDFLV